MSRLDRELTAIFEEAGKYAEPLMVQVIKWIEADVDNIEELTLNYIKEHKPKTYDDYIRDIKRAFREDGWIPPGEEGKPNE
jgi:hypothetical protein